jgi:hypothetical protein
MNGVAALAERCEAVVDGGPFAPGMADLTADIYEALGYEVIRGGRGGRAYSWKYRGVGPLYNSDRWVSMNRLTTSIDAAMTLVPEFYNVDLHRVGKGHRACVWRGAKNTSRYAATLPLALCAAALRARSMIPQIPPHPTRGEGW